MSGKRQPTDLVKAKGRKHLSSAEEEERRQGEVKAKTSKQVRAPDFLPSDLRKEFNEIGKQLIELDIFSKLDRDSLALYLIARQIYLRATNYVQQALTTGAKKDAAEWSAVQDRYFKQCRNCANDMGLTITSRCKLVVPKAEKPVANPVLELLERRNA